MIIVAGEFEFTPGKDAEVVAAMVDMMNETAKEEGCVHYRFYRDVEREHVYHVYEEWETDPHLDAHAASAHMQVFKAALGAIGIVRREVAKREGGPPTAL